MGGNKSVSLFLHWETAWKSPWDTPRSAFRADFVQKSNDKDLMVNWEDKMKRREACDQMRMLTLFLEWVSESGKSMRLREQGLSYNTHTWMGWTKDVELALIWHFPVMNAWFSNLSFSITTPLKIFTQTQKTKGSEQQKWALEKQPSSQWHLQKHLNLSACSFHQAWYGQWGTWSSPAHIIQHNQKDDTMKAS